MDKQSDCYLLHERHIKQRFIHRDYGKRQRNDGDIKVWRKIMNLRELHEYISTFDFRQYGIEQIDFVEIRSKDGKVVYHINTQEHKIPEVVKSLKEWIEAQIVYCYLNRQIREFSIEIMGHDNENRIACIRGM